MPQQLLRVTLIDFHANLDQMKRVLGVLEKRLTTPGRDAAGAHPQVLQQLDRLRTLHDLGTELLVAADAGVKALVADGRLHRAHR